MSDRAVSAALSYVLTLAITTLLISGLLFATMDVVGDRQESVIRGEFGVMGEQVSAGLQTADRLARTDANTVVVTVALPPRAGGEEYLISLAPVQGAVVLTTADEEVSVAVPFENETGVRQSTANGGDVQVVLAGGELEVRST